MADWRFTVPDPVVPRVVDALCTNFGYQPKLADGSDNPETKPQFAKRQVREWIKAQVVAHEASKDAEQARRAASDKATAEIDIT